MMWENRSQQMKRRIEELEIKVERLETVIRTMAGNIEQLKEYSDHDNTRYWELYERIGKLEKKD